MNKLRELRQSRGLTQQQLGDSAGGVGQQRIAEWESDREGTRSIGDASLIVAGRVAAALKVSNPLNLLDEAEKPRKKRR